MQFLLLLLWSSGGVTPVAPAPASTTPSVAETQAKVAVGTYSLEEILAAVRMVETGGERLGGRHSLGDGGSAIGPYQIRRAYWIDARVPGRFEDCRDVRYARAVVLAYWKRYCPAALELRDAETLARTHNGGPDGAKEACTLVYWRKIQRELERARQRAEPRPESRATPRAQEAPRAKAPSPAPVRQPARPGRPAVREPLPPPPDLV